MQNDKGSITEVLHSANDMQLKVHFRCSIQIRLFHCGFRNAPLQLLPGEGAKSEKSTSGRGACCSLEMLVMTCVDMLHLNVIIISNIPIAVLEWCILSIHGLKHSESCDKCRLQTSEMETMSLNKLTF